MIRLPEKSRWALLFVAALLLVWAAVACNQRGEQEATVAAVASTPAVGSGLDRDWLRATPTLVPDLADATPTVGPTPTHTATPTPTPKPAERIELGQELLHEGNFDEAAREFQAALSAPGSLERAEQEAALWGLSRAYISDDRHAEALDALRRYVALADPEEGGTPETGNSGVSSPEAEEPVTARPDDNGRLAEAQFQLAEAHRAMGDCAAAIAAYEAYLQVAAELAAYVQPRIGACYQELGDTAAALAAYDAAIAAPAHRLVEVEARLKVAELQIAAENYAAAIAQYDAVRDLALTENTQSEMTYLAGLAEMQAGNQAAAQQRFLEGVNSYPRSYNSYLGLVQLVDAGIEVEPFQRGLVDYYAEAYAPAIAAFDSYILANPDTYRADTRLYLAWSYEGLGNLEAALAQLRAYGLYEATAEDAPHAAEAAVERAKMLARAGQNETAITAYEEVIANFPESDEAQYATYWSAVLAERLGDAERARAMYVRFAETYPQHEETPWALFHAGLMAWQAGDGAAAHGTWKQLADNYTQTEFGAAALIWLMRTAPDAEAEAYVVTATNLSGAGYYALRAQELATGTEPFERGAVIDLEAREAQEHAEAESWLAQWTELEVADISGELSAELAQDARLVRGEMLWNLGLYADAKRELEEVRQAYARDPLATYQLALYFRDIGLYRSSIIAADTLLLLAGQTVFEAPRLIGRLSYPVYYQDLILELAEAHDYDPLLQFALVRQESLFESFISSHVGAQGLSQVMPATGLDIAQRLGWPDFANEDLYRPFVGLAFGAYYLDQQLRSFDGNVYAALSAYNAGPGNGLRWVSEAPDDPDLFLEVVDYSETRQYIQRIYTGYAAYRWLYGD